MDQRVKLVERQLLETYTVPHSMGHALRRHQSAPLSKQSFNLLERIVPLKGVQKIRFPFFFCRIKMLQINTNMDRSQPFTIGYFFSFVHMQHQKTTNGIILTDVMQKLKILLLITIILTTTKKKYNQYSTVDVNVGLYLVFLSKEKEDKTVTYTLYGFTRHRLQKIFRGSIVFIGLKSCVRLVIKSFLFLLTSKTNRRPFVLQK